MNRFHRLLMAGTVLTGVASLQTAEAGLANGDQANMNSALVARPAIMLAQATTEPEKKKPEAAPAKKLGAPAQAPAVAPLPKPVQPPAVAKPPERVLPPPVTRPVAPPPAAVKPTPPIARPVAPLPSGTGQPTPPAAQKTPPMAPPAAQTKPSMIPPAAQTKPPMIPPAAQTKPPVVPPAAQTKPPTVPPTVPPAAQTKPPAAPPAGQGTVAPAPGTPPAPLQRSGLPAPTPQQARPIPPAASGAGIAPQSANGQAMHRVDELRGERKETREGNRTIIREVDRTIIRENNQTIIRHSEVDRFRYGARDVRVERRGNDNVTIVIRPDGTRIVTIMDNDGFLRRRSRFLADGREIILIDNRPRGPGFAVGVGFGGFFVDLRPPVIRIPRERYIVEYQDASPAVLYETLLAPPVEPIERAYTLDQIRYSAPLRDRMPRIDLNTVTFETGSWELEPDQAQKLESIANGLKRAIEHNPREIFLIEGFTDAVGSADDNLSLSDRRAESVAIALTQQFGVPGENLSTQGYGEQFLKIQTDGPERANRRVSVQRITPLLAGPAQ